MFMKIDGIPGESTDRDHPNEIEVSSYSWGESNAGAHFTAGSGAGAGKVSMQDLHFTAHVSKASPSLMLHCATGQHIPKAKLTVRKVGSEDGGFDFLTITLTDVLISSFQESGSGGGDLPQESISMVYKTVQIEYKQQKPDGSAGAVFDFGFNLLQNRKI